MDEKRTDRTPLQPASTAFGTILPSGSPLDEPLPADLQVALGRFLGTDSVETLREWTRSVREIAGDGALTADALCHTPNETPHRGVMDGETYHFECFYDAVILAAIADEPVEIRTESPQGVAVQARAAGTTVLDVEPPDAVFSFGIDRHVDPPGEEEPSLQTGYESICPNVRAFPTADAYRAWAGTVPAPTVALPLADGTALAASLASEPTE